LANIKDLVDHVERLGVKDKKKITRRAAAARGDDSGGTVGASPDWAQRGKRGFFLQKSRKPAEQRENPNRPPAAKLQLTA